MQPWRNGFDEDYLAALVQLSRQTVKVHSPSQDPQERVVNVSSINGVSLERAIIRERASRMNRLEFHYRQQENSNARS